MEILLGMVSRLGITMDLTNEQEQLAKKIREYASNTKLKNVNKKKIERSK